MPGTRMPTNFPKADNGQRIPLAALVDAPRCEGPEFARLLGETSRRRRSSAIPRGESVARLRLVDRRQRRDGASGRRIRGGQAAPAPATRGRAPRRAGSAAGGPVGRVRLDLTLVLYWSSLGLSAAAVVLFLWLMRAEKVRPGSEQGGRDQRPHPGPLPGGEGED
jgi:hypothetical protein